MHPGIIVAEITVGLVTGILVGMIGLLQLAVWKVNLRSVAYVAAGSILEGLIRTYLLQYYSPLRFRQLLGTVPVAAKDAAGVRPAC